MKLDYVRGFFNHFRKCLMKKIVRLRTVLNIQTPVIKKQLAKFATAPSPASPNCPSSSKATTRRKITGMTVANRTFQSAGDRNTITNASRIHLLDNHWGVATPPRTRLPCFLPNCLANRIVSLKLNILENGAMSGRQRCRMALSLKWLENAEAALFLK